MTNHLEAYQQQALLQKEESLYQIRLCRQAIEKAEREMVGHITQARWFDATWSEIGLVTHDSSNVYDSTVKRYADRLKRRVMGTDAEIGAASLQRTARLET